MALGWLQREKPTETEIKPGGEPEIELKPSEVKTQLDKIASLETTVNGFAAKSAVLDEMKTFLDEQREAREARKAAELAAKATSTSDELADKWTLDPQAAFKESIQPIVATTIQAQSLAMRRELFEDPAFEYYTGDFKKKVDSHIDKLPLNVRADIATMRNCYNVVLGEHMQDIRDNKLKTRFAAASTPLAGAGAGPKTDSERTITLSEDQKKAAKMFGMTEEAYAKQVKEMNIGV